MNILDENSLQRFMQIISEQTGLYIREQDIKKVRDTISSQIKLLRMSSPEEYYRLLETDTRERSQECQILTNCLTTGETYFFRDKGQFALLKNWILPELINARKTEHTLRIWSAGCATGEEAYSVAMLIDELIPEKKEWDITILGTDINHDAIKKARQGIYREWSFRHMDDCLRNSYFTLNRDEWKIHEHIQKMVAFQTGNLIKDEYPNSEIYDIDLVVCRNVFIYFNASAVSLVVAKFIDTIREGGYLMTGHSELYTQNPQCLKPRTFPESVIYQKVSKPAIAELIPKIKAERRFIPRPKPSTATAIRETAVVKKRDISPLMNEAEEFFHNGNYHMAIETAERIIRENPDHFHARYLIARAYANMGRGDKAADNCLQALKVDPLRAEPYYLLAKIACEKGDLEKEKEMLKKVVYLAPSHPGAYLEMGSIYEHDGDEAKALKMRATALELLRTLPQESRIEPYTELTVAELCAHVKKLMQGDDA